MNVQKHLILFTNPKLGSESAGAYLSFTYYSQPQKKQLSACLANQNIPHTFQLFNLKFAFNLAYY